MAPIMADRNEKLLLELLKRPGNNVCADCGSKRKIFEAFLSFLLTVKWACNRKKSRLYKSDRYKKKNFRGINI
jgi:hypothetical protein